MDNNLLWRQTIEQAFLKNPYFDAAFNQIAFSIDANPAVVNKVGEMLRNEGKCYLQPMLDSTNGVIDRVAQGLLPDWPDVPSEKFRQLTIDIAQELHSIATVYFLKGAMTGMCASIDMLKDKPEANESDLDRQAASSLAAAKASQGAGSNGSGDAAQS